MQRLQSGGGSDQLEGRAGGVGAGQESVQISAVIVAVSGSHLGRLGVIGRVEGGGGEHTEDLTSFVVV